MIAETFYTIVTLFFSYLFLVSGVQKFQDHLRFQGVVTNYQVLPEALSPGVARVLPILEIACGLALLVPGIQNLALGAVLILLLAYTFGIAINVYRGRTHIDCGCGAASKPQLLNKELLLRNSLLSLAVLAALSIKNTMAIENTLPMLWAPWLVSLLAAVFLSMAYHVFNQLSANNDLIERGEQHG